MTHKKQVKFFSVDPQTLRDETTGHEFGSYYRHCLQPSLSSSFLCTGTWTTMEQVLIRTWRCLTGLNLKSVGTPSNRITRYCISCNFNLSIEVVMYGWHVTTKPNTHSLQANWRTYVILNSIFYYTRIDSLVQRNNFTVLSWSFLWYMYM